MSLKPRIPQRQLNLFERFLIWIMRKLARVTVGYVVAFDEEIMRQHGIGGFIKFAQATQKAFKQLELKFGNEVAHLLAAFSSFFNGCDYCAWGHLYATNLLYFERTGKLYPIDETEVHALMMMRDSEVLAELQARLTPVEPEHTRLIKRQHDVRVAEGPLNGEEDRLLVKSVALYEWVNECTILSEAPAPPLDAVARKAKLIAAYNELRKPEREARVKKLAAVSETV